MSNDFELADDAKAEKKAVDAEVKGILDDAFARYLVGEARYGTIDLETDPRNFLREAEEELLDAINYFAFEVARFRRMNAALNARLSGSRDITLNIITRAPEIKDIPDEPTV